MAEKNSNKGYLALLGWSLRAIEALEKFDRRYVVVAPGWAEPFAKENDIPFLPWEFESLDENSYEIAQLPEKEGPMSPFLSAKKRSSGPARSMPI